MDAKTGRNEPCPCGSGLKFKRCHGRAVNDESSAPRAEARASAVETCLSWLMQHHPKGMEKAFFDLLFEDLWPDDGPELDELPEETWHMLAVNLNEWLLAAGDIEVKGAWREINPYLLSNLGPRLGPDERAWIAQLGQRPLRLYTVTDVRRGEGLTLVDAIDFAAEPIVVHERAGSETARPGMTIGCRVMNEGGRFVLSGAIYPFPMLAASAATQAVRDALDQALDPDDLPHLVGIEIMRSWVAAVVGPPAIPTMVDASSGEPLLLTTDHYQVHDESALASALGRCADVQADSDGGWHRLREDDDGVTRWLAAINRGKSADRLEVFYRTQRMADEGRAWFEAVAGTAVRYLTREIVDPKGALSKRLGRAQPGSAPSTSELPPEALADAIEEVVRRNYAHWADEPIPALDGQTPRQAIRTAAGLERVKGLLRSYEAGEADMARAQGRREISYQFLWDALQIER